MRGHFGAVITGALYAHNAAGIVHHEAFGRGAKHDAVGLVRVEEGGHRRDEVGAPASGIAFGFAVAVGVHLGADELVFTIPQRADEGGLGVFNEGGTHGLQPRLEILAVLDELRHEVIVAVDPLAAVGAGPQAAVVGLEDVQVQRGEQGQLAFGRAGIQLGLRPIQVRLNLGLKRLQGGQVFLMHAVLGQLTNVARDELVVQVVVGVEGLFAPVKDDLELVDAALHGLDLVIGVAVKAHAGGGVGILGIPYQVRHHALVLAAGHQRVAADLSILFDDEHGVAVLRGLRSRGNAGAAGAHDDHVVGLLDGILRGHFNRVGLEGSKVGAAGLLGSRVHGVAQRAAGERGAAHGVHAGAVGLHDLGNHDVKGHVADVFGFHRGDHLDVRHGGFAEGDVHGQVAVIAGGGSGVGSGRKSELRFVGGRFAGGLRQRAGNGFLDGRARNGCSSPHVNVVRRGNAYQRGVEIRDGFLAITVGLVVADDLDGRHGRFVNG